MPLNWCTRLRSWILRCAIRSSRDNNPLSRWCSGGTWNKSDWTSDAIATGSTTTAATIRKFVRFFVALIAWHLPFNGPCLIPVNLSLPFSHVATTWCNCDADVDCCWIFVGASVDGCDADEMVMEWWVVAALLWIKYCPFKDAGWNWLDLKNFGEVRVGDFVTSPSLVDFFSGGSGDKLSNDAIDGSCWRNCWL